MMPRKETEAALRLVGGSEDAAIDLGEAALALAALDRPGVSLDHYRGELGRLAAATAKAHAGIDDRFGARRCHAALTQAIVDEFGFAGDRATYDNLQNASLMRVIDRKRGLPIALGILYIVAGRAQGWTIDGLNFPGHFLLRLEAGGERLIFDPFDDGAPLDPAAMRALLKQSSGSGAELTPEHYAPASNRDILLRLQNNIKIRLLRAERTEAALRIVESMLMFAPGRPSLWYEAGLLHSHLGNLRGALLALGQCHDIAEDPRLRDEVTRMMTSIRTRLN
ncbi:MAG: transglutaminase-like domain-containing protein [Alphaproteobacteria bacterium]|jgi:regulator of sirC expression with transglutaminase-like and TPR domain